MPQSDIHQPGSAGAIDRLALTTAEVRGADSHMLGSPPCCLPPACCAACFEADPQVMMSCCSICFEADGSV